MAGRHQPQRGSAFRLPLANTSERFDGVQGGATVVGPMEQDREFHAFARMREIGGKVHRSVGPMLKALPKKQSGSKGEQSETR